MKTRYFFVSVIMTIDGGSRVHNFDYKTFDGKHPTYKELVSVSHKKYETAIDLMLVGVSELSETDWNDFISEQ